MKTILIVFIIAITSIECCAKVTADSILLAVACEQMRPPKYNELSLYKLSDEIKELNLSEYIKINQKYDVIFLLEVCPLEVIDGCHLSIWNKSSAVNFDKDGFIPDDEYWQNMREKISHWDKDRILRHHERVKNHIHDGESYVASKIIVKKGKIINIDTVYFRELYDD